MKDKDFEFNKICNILFYIVTIVALLISIVFFSTKINSFMLLVLFVIYIALYFIHKKYNEQIIEKYYIDKEIYIALLNKYTEK